MSEVIRRTPRILIGYTTGDGFKKPGTPPEWPFGMRPDAKERALKKAKMKAILKSLKD